MEKIYYLDLEDLAYNLFYILTKNKSDIRKVSFNQIKKHKEIIKKEAADNDTKLVFALSRDDTTKFFVDNRYLFERGEDDNSIVLRDGVTPYHIIWDRAYLPLPVKLVLTSKNVEEETLAMMGVEKRNEELDDIKVYIAELTTRIKELAEKMEFEKCIELRGKLKDLQSIDKQLNETEDKKDSEGKTLIKTNNN